MIHRNGPWRGFEDAEMVTLLRVARFKQEHLLSPPGYVPPSSIEAQDYDTHRTRTAVGVIN